MMQSAGQSRSSRESDLIMPQSRPKKRVFGWMEFPAYFHTKRQAVAAVKRYRKESPEFEYKVKRVLPVDARIIGKGWTVLMREKAIRQVRRRGIRVCQKGNLKY